MRLWERRASTVVVDGIRIANGDWADDDAHLAALRRIADALELIRSVDRRRYARLTQDVRRIILIPQLGTPAAFIPSRRAVTVGPEYVTNASLPKLAMTLVHEATHARLHAAGIGIEEEIRARLERVCVEQEAQFAEALGPQHAHLAAKARQRLDQPYWAAEERFAASFADLQRLGAPKWVLRVMSALFRP